MVNFCCCVRVGVAEEILRKVTVVMGCDCPIRAFVRRCERSRRTRGAVGLIKSDSHGLQNCSANSKPIRKGQRNDSLGAN